MAQSHPWMPQTTHYLAKEYNAKLTALHVVNSGDAYRYISNLIEVRTPTSMDSIMQTARQEFQKWFGTLDQKVHESNVESYVVMTVVVLCSHFFLFLFLLLFFHLLFH
jgi:hypothetical protein